MAWKSCRVLVGALIAIFASGSVSGPAVRITAPGVEERVIRPGKLQPVELSREELQSAIRQLTANLRLPKRAVTSAKVDVRLASSDEAERALVADYLRWCAQRREPGDCLGVVSPSGLLVAEAKEKVALGSITPLELRVMILGTMTAYVARRQHHSQDQGRQAGGSRHPSHRGR